jgi:hypothetical protein
MKGLELRSASLEAGIEVVKLVDVRSKDVTILDEDDM